MTEQSTPPGQVQLQSLSAQFPIALIEQFENIGLASAGRILRFHFFIVTNCRYRRAAPSGIPNFSAYSAIAHGGACPGNNLRSAVPIEYICLIF